MVVFYIATHLLWLLVVVRFLVPLPWEPGAKLIVALLLLLGAQHRFLVVLLRRSRFSTEIPRAGGILGNVLFGTLLFLAIFQTGMDILAIVISLLKGTWLAAPVAARYVAGTSAVVLSVYGVHQAIRLPQVKEIVIAISRLPDEFDGYRLVQLTDLHLSRMFPARWATEVVARANAMNPDVIVLTGDLIDGSPKTRKDDVEPLRGLRARDGVFVVSGNHEYYFGYEGWMSRFQTLGMKRLCNSHALLRRGSSSLVLAGVTDIASIRFGLPKPDIRKALEGAPSGAPVIMLNHQPKGATEASRAGVSLQLSGHTHGGMVLGLHRIVARFNGGFVSGLYEVDGMQLYVSPGAALWNGFALRVGVPSELSVITLRKDHT